MITKPAQNSWLRKNDESVSAWKGFEATERERVYEDTGVTRGRKMYIYWWEKYKRKNKERNITCGTEEKTKFAVNFDRYPTLKFS